MICDTDPTKDGKGKRHVVCRRSIGVQSDLGSGGHLGRPGKSVLVSLSLSFDVLGDSSLW